MSLLLRAFMGTCLILLCPFLDAQEPSLSFQLEKERLSTGEVLLTIRSVLPPGIQLYSIDKKSEDAPHSSIRFDSAGRRYITGAPTEKGKVRRERDPLLETEVAYLTDSVVWQQVARVPASDSVVLKGTIAYMYKKGEEYLPGEQAIKFFIDREAGAGAAALVKGASSTIATRSLLWIFLTAFGGGLLALLTPCVYSMIPITVSFFTKRSKTRPEGIRHALYYSASIVTIFTVLGFLVTLVFGPAALNNMATNWIANLAFFLVFLVFGISFLGAFDITLPASWSTRTDSKAGMGSFGGIFFMALTLVVVSFSCTGPIIGNLLVLAAKGSYWGPLTGMAGFSLALALPFALFAFFPSRLNILGKAGGWLNAVKVTLGFLELALALKFLSNADLARGWRLLDREVFISLWIVIFALLGVYLLGKIRFHHDDELPRNDFGLPYLSVTRLLFSLTAFAFAVYMVPGLWGAPLKGISAFVPPMGTQDFTASAASPSQATQTNYSPPGRAPGGAPHPEKYYEQMKIYEPEVVTKYGMVTYFDYDEALAVARRLQKPLMLDFTGINCVNCRKMEGQVWSDPEVMQRLKEDFVIASLYVDVHHIDLQPSEQYYSKALGKQVETLGDKYADLQVTRFGANTQPYYFFLDADENRLVDEGYGYNPNARQFISLLEKAKQAYQKEKKL